MLDPFSDVIDWSKMPPLKEGFGMMEHFDRDDMLIRLGGLPPIEGAWKNPASLSRFGRRKMSARQLSRFLEKVKPAQLDYGTPCWIWHGGTHDKGYGRFYLGKDPVYETKIWSYTHRISFEHWVGPIPPGYIGDHQCNHKICCNPTHVWPETNNENLRLADERRPWKRRNQYSKE